MRNIFAKPIERTMEAIHFEWLMAINSGRLTEQDLALSLRITKRDVRMIASRFNFRQYINADNSVKYVVVDKRYYRITKDSPQAELTLNKRLFDMIKALKVYKIYSEDIGEKINLTYTIDEMLKKYEE